MHRALSIVAILATGPTVADALIQAHATGVSRPVFACFFQGGSVSVTVSGGKLTLRLKAAGKGDTVVTGTAAQRTVLYRQDRYAGAEYQLRFVTGRRSYIVYSMDGDRQTEAQPVSGLSVLLDRALQSDLACVPHAAFTAALSDVSLAEDGPEYAAMNLQ